MKYFKFYVFIPYIVFLWISFYGMHEADPKLYMRTIDTIIEAAATLAAPWIPSMIFVVPLWIVHITKKEKKKQLEKMKAYRKMQNTDTYLVELEVINE